MGQLRILGPEGDTKHIWDCGDDDQVKAARKLFGELVGKGHLAFRVKKDGSKSRAMKSFDPDAEAVILVPPLAGG